MAARVAAKRYGWLLVRCRAALRAPMLLAVVIAAAGFGAPAPLTAEVPAAAEPVAPHSSGWVDVGPPLVGAEVHVVGADGTKIAGPALTDDGGFYRLDVAEVPADARVVATGGTYGAAPFDGTLSALVERYPDGTVAPTFVTVATTLQVERLDAAPGTAAADAAAEVATILGLGNGQMSLGIDVALAESVVPQDELLRVAAANGGFDAFADRLVRRDAAALDLVPRARFALVAPGAAAAAADGDMVGDIAQFVGKLILGKGADVVIKAIGLDHQQNALNNIYSQLRSLDQQVKDLTVQVQDLAGRIEAIAFQNEVSRYQTNYVNGVTTASLVLADVARKGAAVQDAEEKKPGSGEVQKASLQVSLDELLALCERTSFLEVPGALTTQFQQSKTSLLESYLATVMRPRRYLTRADSLRFSNFFYSYYVIQLQALRLHAECTLLRRKNPTESYANEVVTTTFAEDNPNSHFNRARLAQLPKAMPQMLNEGEVVLDHQTGLLWWNGTVSGRHPAQKVIATGVIPSTLPASSTPRGPNGAWSFELASAADIRTLAPLGARLPPERRNQGAPQPGAPPAPTTYPNELRAFLTDIGLTRVADSGAAQGWFWAADKRIPIFRCGAPSQHAGCDRRNRHDLGSTGVTVLNDGKLSHGPMHCPSFQCNQDGSPRTGVIVACNPRDNRSDPGCIWDNKFGETQGPGMYRAKLLPKDRFTIVDLTVLK